MKFILTILLSVMAAAVSFGLGMSLQIPMKFLFAPALGAAVGVLAGYKCKGMTGAAVGGMVALLLAGIITGVFKTSFIDKSQLGKVMDISGSTLSGQQYDIKAVNAKVYLVDFWATWCGPCVGEMPNIKRVYEEFHPRGLEIVGVSLDNNKEDLASGVKALQIQWPQIVPEGEGGWDAPLAKKYGITSIPSLFLLDSNQQILAQSIRGSALRPAVEAAFKSAENGTAFQNNAEQSLQLSPIAIIACPLLAMLGAFSGTFLELRFNKRAIPELEQIKGTIVLELVEAITELGWVPLLVLAAKQSQIGPIFYVFAALLFLYAGLQIFVIGHYYLGKPDRVEQLASSRFIKTVIKGPWLQRIYADSLVKAGNFRDAQQVYEGIINSQPENRAAPALVRNHLALVLMQNDNPGESELRDPVCVLPATPVVGTPADLSRARSVAIIGYSITVIGIWLSLQN